MAEIISLRYAGDITGSGITTQWDVSGTDLGIPVYSPKQQRMYYLFGDTFGVPKKKTEGLNSFVPEASAGGSERNWRGTIAGYSDCFDISGGIRWDGFIPDENGDARALIPAHYSHRTNTEVTKICQGGIEINGNLYCFYESIRHWGPTGSGYWDVSYSGAIRSGDGGKTFERVYDMSWCETDRGEFADTIKTLVTEDMALQPSGVDFDLSAHVAPSFGQMFACDGKDGYVYIYGRHGGRIHGIKTGRVRYDDIERFDAYEYLTGWEHGAPVWVKGSRGAVAAMDIIPAPTSNMSVYYNAYLQRWMLCYFKPETGILYALADTPYGPYSTPEMMISINDPLVTRDNPTGGNRLYGAFTHELLCRENGRIVPVIYSRWYEKNYNSAIIDVTFER